MSTGGDPGFGAAGWAWVPPHGGVTHKAIPVGHRKSVVTVVAKAFGGVIPYCSSEIMVCSSRLLTPDHHLPTHMRPVAILQNDGLVPPGLLGESFAERSVPGVVIEVFRGDSLPEPGEVSGVAILGGHMGAYDEQAHPFLTEEKELVRRAVGRGVPVLGICLGCQVIADALGGRAYRVEPQEAGLIDLRVTEAGLQDSVMAVLEGPLASWHHDSWDLPPGGTLLAVSDRYPQALRVGSAIGVQFHPEVTPDILEGWIGRNGDSLHEVGMDPALFLDALRASRDALRRRADRLFGAWISEVRRRSP